MWATRRTTVGGGVGLVVALLAAVAAYLAHTGSSAEAKLRDDFARRAVVAATMTGSGLDASDERNRQWATENLAGPAGGLQAALDSAAEQSIVLDARGAVLAAYPRSLRSGASLPAITETGREAIRTGRIFWGDVLPGGAPFQVLMAQPYATPTGTRVLVQPLGVDFVDGFADGYLSSALELAEGRAYVVDRNGAVLAASADGVALGQPLPDAPADGRLSLASGQVSNSGWRVVFTVPDHVLLAPITSTQRSAWLVFAGFATALVALLFVNLTALNRSARLAHLRRHDPLTGLANRALVEEQMARELSKRSSRGAAVLFIDLDGFKPVNDRYGHAAGDALLVGVAERLVSATRPGDVASRIGGDEFLVFCRDLADAADAERVAERIRELLMEPFPVGEHTIRIGCSIGVAVKADGIAEPGALIRNADAAMYRAKRGGKNRVVRHNEEPITAGHS